MEQEKNNAPEDKTPKSAKSAQKNAKIAIVRVRGRVRVKKEIEETMQRLNLFRVNYCAVYDDTPSIRGMVQKVKDYVTWGEINDETLKMLHVARAKPDKSENPKSEIKRFFRLNPPLKGYGRKGIKKPFSVGGALGYRGDKINDLIKRML